MYEQEEGLAGLSTRTGAATREVGHASSETGRVAYVHRASYAPAAGLFPPCYEPVIRLLIAPPFWRSDVLKGSNRRGFRGYVAHGAH